MVTLKHKRKVLTDKHTLKEKMDQAFEEGMKTTNKQVFIGIDPGVKGGLCCLSNFSQEVVAEKMPDTELDVYSWLYGVARTDNPLPCFAYVERIDPRPTRFFRNGKWESSILKSTCLIYANYMRLRAFMLALQIPFEAIDSKVWQKGLKIRAKEKGESATSWKNRLKARAQEIFPDQKVTLAIADALLIGEYCRRKRTGTL